MTTPPTLDEIWEGDLFNRRAEAVVLASYIESVAKRSQSREDWSSFTIAVDVGYGHGKTFFLTRLAKHLALSHPVAYVDAWADDVADEPLSALAATLKAAIEPAVKAKPSLSTKVSSFLEASGKIAKVMAVGAVRRSASAVFTSVAIETVEHIAKDAHESAKEVATAAAEGAAQGSLQSAETALQKLRPRDLMKARVASFEEGKAASKAMKNSLRSLVDHLPSELSPPIVIIVDELDRCRPTYAIKLLEEIKHLFDVPGIVFVFGLHGEQLSQSIRGAYGAEFRGDEYLRRFIGRRYRLKEPNLEPLLTKLLGDAGITNDDFLPFDIEIQRAHGRVLPIESELARYMRNYDLTVRDAFQVLDILQTCVALTDGEKLIAPYLFPLIMSFIKGAKPGEFTEPVRDDTHWQYALYPSMGSRVTYTFATLSRELDMRFKLSELDLRNRLNNNPDALTEFAYDRRARAAINGNPARYDELLQAVGQFE